MKRTIALILAVLLLAFCMAGCGEKEETGNARTLTVGFDAEFPPFGFIAEDGSYDGFDLAVAEEVCKRLGWTFKAQPIAWSAKDAELSSGNIDCIWNGFTMQGREDDYAWTPAYYDNSIVVVVRADSGIETLADLAGKSVITQAGSSGVTALEGAPELSGSFSELLESANYNNCYMELDMGTVNAVVSDVGVAAYNIAGKEAEYRILAETIASETYGIGFLKGNDALAAEVWAAVEAIAADGTLGTIADRYVSFGLVKESICVG